MHNCIAMDVALVGTTWNSFSQDLHCKHRFLAEFEEIVFAHLALVLVLSSASRDVAFRSLFWSTFPYTVDFV